MKQTKRALIAVIACLAVLVAATIGTTYAWFTDSVANSGNRIEAGTLDLQVFKYTGTGTPSTVADQAADWTEITNSSNSDFVFGDAFKNIKPGDTKNIYLAVKNSGSLKFNYSLDMIVATDELSEVLLINSEQIVNTSLAAITKMVVTDGKVGVVTAASVESNTEVYITIAIKMAESAGNSYQGKNFNADISFVASQEGAIVVYAASIEEITNAEEGATVIVTKDITGDLTITKAVNIDLNGHRLTGNVTVNDFTTYGLASIFNGTVKGTVISELNNGVFTNTANIAKVERA